MPIATYQHCIICYKEHVPIKIKPSPGKRGGPKVENKNGEVCRRFCTLASRHLDLDPFHFRSEKTLWSKCQQNMETVCDTCLELASSFCELYGKMEYLQMQLDWRLLEMCEVMKNADKKSAPYGAFRKALEKKVANFGGTMDYIDEFRTEFLEAAELMKKRSIPRVLVKRPNQNNDDEDADSEGSLFLPCTPSPPKQSPKKVAKEVKKKMTRKRKHSESSGSASTESSITPTPVPVVAITTTKAKARKVSPKKKPVLPLKPIYSSPPKPGPGRPRRNAVKTTTTTTKKSPPKAVASKKAPMKPKAKAAKNKSPRVAARPVIQSARMSTRVIGDPLRLSVPAPPKVTRSKTVAEVFMDSSDSESDKSDEDLFVLIPSSEAKLLRDSKKDKSESSSSEEEEQEEEIEEKVTLFSKPGGKISLKDRVPNASEYVRGWLNG